ncbi:MAG: peptidylprolyl isomerase [Betaproteobacteria bacterium]|nr:peptidylprolyl isomerase [Betaproteobacteria bacterium]MBI2960898.1 peptidylprolyl isomerase [Betaproteobacteria bacterium]
MLVCKNTVVSLEVELSDIWGNLIEKPSEPLYYLHGGYGDIFPAVEAALEGKAENDRVSVRLEPEDAYGEYDQSLLELAPRAEFPETLEVGMRVERGAGDADQYAVYTVTDIAEDKVVLDGNHALAGMALQFVCTVVGVRPARDEEIANGSADDPASVIVRVLP